MRWFKHLSRARRDEKIAALMADCGIEGYGFYFLLCEVIAEALEKDGVPALTYTLPQWSHALYSHHHRVSKYLGKLRVTGLCEVSEVDGKIRVTIPNLLKYRDEYAGKSRHSPIELPTDSRPSHARVSETETDAEEEKEPPTPTAPTGAGSDGKSLAVVSISHGILARPTIRASREKRSSEQIKAALGPERLTWWENFWRVFPCRQSMREGLEAFERKITTRELAVAVYQGARRYAALAEAQPDMKLKYAQGWLNGERWNDECAIPVKPLSVHQERSRQTHNFSELMEQMRNSG